MISQMAALPSTCLIFFIFFLPHTARSTQLCETKHCGWLALGPFDFPFQLTGANGTGPCGYPDDFKVLCNDRNQTVLSLPKAGDFVVTSISLDEQEVKINDPAGCLPRRFMNGFDLIGSPFEWGSYYSFIQMSFVNCTANLTDIPADLQKLTIPCLGTQENLIIANDTELGPQLPESCQFISLAKVPSGLFSEHNIYPDIQLKWKKPDCRVCGYQQCSSLKKAGLQFRCDINPNNDNHPSQGGDYEYNDDHDPFHLVPKTAAIVFVILVLLLVLCCCYCCCYCMRKEDDDQQPPKGLIVIIRRVIRIDSNHAQNPVQNNTVI